MNLTALFGINVGTRDFWGNSIVNKSTFNVGALQLTASGRAISEQAQNNLITKAVLHAFPNPISSSSTLRFVSPRSEQATILLFDSEGKLIKSLFWGEVNAGEYKNLELDASGLSNGLYIIRMFSAEKSYN